MRSVESRARSAVRSSRCRCPAAARPAARGDRRPQRPCASARWRSPAVGSEAGGKWCPGARAAGRWSGTMAVGMITTSAPRFPAMDQPDASRSEGIERGQSREYAQRRAPSPRPARARRRGPRQRSGRAGRYRPIRRRPLRWRAESATRGLAGDDDSCARSETVFGERRRAHRRQSRARAPRIGDARAERLLGLGRKRLTAGCAAVDAGASVCARGRLYQPSSISPGSPGADRDH